MLLLQGKLYGCVQRVMIARVKLRSEGGTHTSHDVHMPQTVGLHTQPLRHIAKHTDAFSDLHQL
jgi:hypothetical protein